MKALSVSEVLASANASLVAPNLDVGGAVANLLKGATQSLPADAAAVLVDVQGSLEVLAATSHAVAYVEVHQMQSLEGPCLDAIRYGRTIEACGADTIITRWPTAGAAIVRAGYNAVQAVPLNWQGTTFGGLNFFRQDATAFDPTFAEGRALADALTLLIVTRDLNGRSLADGLQAALDARAVVEQAKGALAHAASLDMASAFEKLVAIAESRGITLGVAARYVMHHARTKTLDRL